MSYPNVNYIYLTRFIKEGRLMLMLMLILTAEYYVHCYNETSRVLEQETK